MEVKKFLLEYKQTFIGALIGLIIAWFFYWISEKERLPIFAVESHRVEILNAEKVDNAPIIVLKKDSTEIKNNLYAANFYFWNAGKAVIEREDILVKPKVFFNSDVEILDFKILKSSRDVCKIQLYPINKESFGIDFKILENEDGLSGQIIYQGDVNAPIDIEGIFVGAEKVSTDIPFSIKAYLYANVTWFIIFLPMLFAIVYGYYNTKDKKKWNFLFIFILFCGLFLFIFLTTITYNRQGEVSKVRTRTTENIGLSKKVPISIIP